MWACLVKPQWASLRFLSVEDEVCLPKLQGVCVCVFLLGLSQTDKREVTAWAAAGDNTSRSRCKGTGVRSDSVTLWVYVCVCVCLCLFVTEMERINNTESKLSESWLVAHDNTGVLVLNYIVWLAPPCNIEHSGTLLLHSELSQVEHFILLGSVAYH